MQCVRLTLISQRAFCCGLSWNIRASNWIRFHQPVRSQRHLHKVARSEAAGVKRASHMDVQWKLWLDCDLGIDDGFGLLMALSDPNSTVLAVSSVYGNTDSRQVALNIGRMLALCDRSDLPVYVGCDEPLVRPKKPSPRWYGGDGLGDAPQARPRPSDARPYLPGAAASKLVECAAEHDGSLTVVALGPLTNIALALKLDPLLPSRLKRLVIMGSGGENGGVEFNFGADPESAKVVFDKFCAASATGQPSSLMLVGLDVSDRSLLPWHTWESIVQRDTPKARFLQAITEQCVADTKSYSPQGWPLADPLAVAVALQPGIVTASREVHVEVEVQGSDHVAGMAIIDGKGSKGGKTKSVQLITGVETSTFYTMCMRGLE